VRVPCKPWMPSVTCFIASIAAGQPYKRCGCMAPMAGSSVKSQGLSAAHIQPRVADCWLPATPTSYLPHISTGCTHHLRAQMPPPLHISHVSAMGGAPPAGTKAPKVFQPGRTRISRGGPPRASSPLVSGGSGGSQDWGPADPDAPPPGRRRSSAPGEDCAESPSSLSESHP
jgi:hypothetical protein